MMHVARQVSQYVTIVRVVSLSEMCCYTKTFFLQNIRVDIDNLLQTNMFLYTFMIV